MYNWFETIEFFYIKFFFNPNSALVPRFETESLVRESIKVVNNQNIKILIDVGIWSWIIPISIEKNTNTLEKIYWLDKSKKALKLAKINKELNFSKIELIYSDLLKEFLNWNIKINEDKVLITSNLPYIKTDDWNNMWYDLLEEPRMALFWWKNTGFELYKKFFKQALELKKLYKKTKFILICEFWHNHSDLAYIFFKKYNIKTSFLPDQRWIMRFIYIEI